MIWRWVVGVVLGAIVLGYMLSTFVFFPGFGRGPVVTVPNLRGKSLAQARRQLDRVDLVLERGSSLVHPSIPAGAVLAQNPLPGQETSRGDAVHVTLSAGPDRRPVPPVEGLTGEQAQAVLRRTGFQVRVDTVPDDRPAGRIVGLRPAPGTVLRVPAAVQLLLAQGPPPPPPQEAAPEPEPAVRERGPRLLGVPVTEAEPDTTS